MRLFFLWLSFEGLCLAVIVVSAVVTTLLFIFSGAVASRRTEVSTLGTVGRPDRAPGLAAISQPQAYGAA